MIVLSRRVSECIAIGDHIVLTVSEIRPASDDARIRLGIEAPRETPIHRFQVRAAMDEMLRSLPAELEEHDSVSVFLRLSESFAIGERVHITLVEIRPVGSCARVMCSFHGPQAIAEFVSKATFRPWSVEHMLLGCFESISLAEAVAIVGVLYTYGIYWTFDPTDRIVRALEPEDASLLVANLFGIGASELLQAFRANWATLNQSDVTSRIKSRIESHESVSRLESWSEDLG